MAILLNVLIGLLLIGGLILISVKKNMRAGWRALMLIGFLALALVAVLGGRKSIEDKRGPLIEWKYALAQEEKLRVGFDLDGTLIYSRPNFAEAFAKTKPLSPECFALVNAADERYSKIKTSGKKILDRHRTRGDAIFVVTSRGAENGDKLKDYLSANFGVAPENVYFSGDDKTDVLKQLKLNWFYGDFDLDITSAQNAGVTPYRVLLGEAEYKKPEKYNPGKFGETIIPGTEWVVPGQEDWNQGVAGPSATEQKDGKRNSNWISIALVIFFGVAFIAVYCFSRKNARLPAGATPCQPKE